METTGAHGWLCNLARFANNTHNEKEHTLALNHSENLF